MEVRGNSLAANLNISQKDPYSVEWRNDANLIACAGYNTAKVFDIRSQKPVRIFQQLHTCKKRVLC